MADKLPTLLRLRRLQASLSRANLAQALAGEHRAEGRLAEARAAPAREAASLPAMDASPLAAAAFACWLPAAADAIGRHTTTVRDAEAARLDAAAEARSSQRAVEAVEKLRDLRALAGRKKAQRRTQSGLDDLAARGQRR